MPVVVPRAVLFRSLDDLQLDDLDVLLRAEWEDEGVVERLVVLVVDLYEGEALVLDLVVLQKISLILGESLDPHVQKLLAHLIQYPLNLLSFVDEADYSLRRPVDEEDLVLGRFELLGLLQKRHHLFDG